MFLPISRHQPVGLAPPVMKVAVPSDSSTCGLIERPDFHRQSEPRLSGTSVEVSAPRPRALLVRTSRRRGEAGRYGKADPVRVLGMLRT